MEDLSLRRLYQETLLHHSRTPCNFGALPPPSHKAEGFNPLCGDRQSVWVRTDADNRLAAVSFEGTGCAISLASASIMTEAVSGLQTAQIERLFEAFRALCTSPELETLHPLADEYESLTIFAGVREYPMRVKCATLPWHTLRAALRGESEADSESED